MEAIERTRNHFFENRHAPVRHQQSPHDAARADCQQQILRQDLAHLAGEWAARPLVQTAISARQAEGARQQQIRDITACDQQCAGSRGEQDEKRRSRVAPRNLFYVLQGHLK